MFRHLFADMKRFLMPSDAQDPCWLHISDLHFDGRETYDRVVILSALIASLTDLTGRAGKPDFVVVSGDIANTGKESEYQQASIFFDALIDALALTKEQIIVVPGNHDVDRSRGVGLSRTLHDMDESDNYFNDSSECLHIASRMSAYSAWYDSYFSGIRSFAKNSSISDEIVLSVRSRTVRVTPINSSAFCFDEADHGKLWIGRRSLDRFSGKAEREDDLRIAVMHHPIDWLHHDDKVIVKSCLQEHFDCILTGHLHNTDIESVNGLSGECVHLAAGASYQTSKWPNTAMFVRLGQDNLTVLPIHFVIQPKARWTVDTSIYHRSGDYSGTIALSRFAKCSTHLPDRLAGDSELTRADVAETPESTFDEDLFVADGKPIYIRPRIMSRPQEQGFSDAETAASTTIEEIVSSSDSYMIEARTEYGGSTLAKRVEFEMRSTSQVPFRKDARDLPNYRRKLEAKFPKDMQPDVSVLILDHFDLDRDEKLLRELIDSKWFRRIIVIAVNRGVAASNSVSADILGEKFRYFYLWGMSREDIRTAATAVFQSNDGPFISAIVSKVYGDLLSLCIPLTPANVLMYLKVLHREGEFQPLNRVDIVGKYIQESISRPSDVYKDMFNVKNRMDVMSSFVYRLYKEEKSSFEEKYWSAFVNQHKAETLTEFDESTLLDEMIESRIFSKQGSEIFLRYSFFYSYFLGRQLFIKAALLREFIENDEYLRMGNVVDVVTGLSSENEFVVNYLVNALKAKLQEFSDVYIRSTFDPFEHAVWPDSNKEDEELWGPISKEIESGPRDVKQIDSLKTSLFSEARTAEQVVSFEKFTDLENAIFCTSLILCDALKNSDDIPGPLKLEAYDSIIRTRLVSFQVGTMFAEVLSKKRYFRWGGVSFLDFNKSVENLPAGSPEAKMTLIEALCSTISRQGAEELGTAKLSAVFKYRELQEPRISFLELHNFNSILIAKGPGWDKTLSKMIDRTGKNSFYLWGMLSSLMDHYGNEVLHLRDIDSMKRLVAQIEAKRGLNKEVPGSKAVTRVLGRLEAAKHFDGIRPGPAKADDWSEP